MNRFLEEVLPKALIEAQANRKALEVEKWQAAARLDEDDRFQGHSCDCEYCESQDYEELDAVEREELEEKLENLAQKIADFDKDIKSMTEYKAFMERQSS